METPRLNYFIIPEGMKTILDSLNKYNISYSIAFHYLTYPVGWFEITLEKKIDDPGLLGLLEFTEGLSKTYIEKQKKKITELCLMELDYDKAKYDINALMLHILLQTPENKTKDIKGILGKNLKSEIAKKFMPSAKPQRKRVKL